MLKQVPIDFLTYFHPGFYDLGAELPAGGGPEGFDDANGARHSPREFFDYLPHAEGLVIHHVPKRVRKCVGSPAELVGVIEAVANKLSPLAACGRRRRECLMIPYGVGYASNFVLAERKGAENTFCLLSSTLSVLFLSIATYVMQNPRIDAVHHKPFDSERFHPVPGGLNIDERGAVDADMSAVQGAVTERFVTAGLQHPAKARNPRMVIEKPFRNGKRRFESGVELGKRMF